MSSGSALQPFPAVPVYSSSKLFVLQMSRSLQLTYPTKKCRLVFHAFHPQFVETAMTTKGPVTIESVRPIKYARSKIFPDSDSWMESALKV